jgi:hypothetical protein
MMNASANEDIVSIESLIALMPDLAIALRDAVCLLCSLLVFSLQWLIKI